MGPKIQRKPLLSVQICRAAVSGEAITHRVLSCVETFAFLLSTLSTDDKYAVCLLCGR